MILEKRLFFLKLLPAIFPNLHTSHVVVKFWLSRQISTQKAMNKAYAHLALQRASSCLPTRSV